MKSFKFLFLMFSFSPVILFSQVDISQFDKWVGEWEGTLEIQGNKNKETLNNKWVLNHSFSQMELLGQQADNPDTKYMTTFFFTFDRDENIIGWSFSDDGYNGVINYKGKVSGNKVTLNGKNPGFTYILTFEFKDNSIYRKAEFKMKGRDEGTVSETIFKKKS